jgi:OOP family OmpA-OmpF porin
VTLAAWLAESAERRIVLVGHTDAEGALDSNIELSRARAAAVRNALVTEFGADPARIEAAGVGYLAPRAANSLAEGREANRRVEVVLISE